MWHMASTGSLPLPFVLDWRHFALDDAVSFSVAVLVAVLVNGEAQAYAAALLGDARRDAKDRLHFNAFLHLDLLGTLCFVIGGVGWGRRVDVDVSKFSHPRLYLVLTRFAGPCGNFLMANIAASVVWLFSQLSTDPRVFLILMSVNLAVAAYNLLPVAPLAAGSILSALVLYPDRQLEAGFERYGPYVAIAIFLVDRVSGGDFIGGLFAPLLRALFELLSAAATP
jgi:Zn-dependent protease